MEKNSDNENIFNNIDLTNYSRGITPLYFLTAFNLVSYACGANFELLYCQGAFKEITGYDEQDFLNGLIGWEQLIHPEDLVNFQNVREDLLKGKIESYRIEYRIISGNGKVNWLNDMCIIDKDAHNQIKTIQGFLMDVTRRKLAEEQSLEREAHLNSILNSVQDVIWSVTPDTFELLYINPAAETVYECRLSDLYRKPDGETATNPLHLELLLENFSTLLQRGWFETEFCLNLPDGKKRWLHRRAHFARDAHGIVARIDGIDTDITSRKKAEDTLKYLSSHDALTGLGNRRSFEEELQEINKRNSVGVGLIICDIDGLKTVNDKLGHTMGDHLLTECAGILYDCLGEKANISRIGGDEFTILLESCTEAELANAAAGIRIAIRNYNHKRPLLPLSMSIGHALKCRSEMSMDEAFRLADNLMYKEKEINHKHIEEMLVHSLDYNLEFNNDL